jgi:hypothetical protein
MPRCYLLVIKKNNRRFAHARNIQNQAEECRPPPK